MFKVYCKFFNKFKFLIKHLDRKKIVNFLWESFKIPTSLQCVNEGLEAIFREKTLYKTTAIQCANFYRLTKRHEHLIATFKKQPICVPFAGGFSKFHPQISVYLSPELL